MTLFDVVPNVLTSWRTFGRHVEVFDVRIFFDIMTSFWWHTDLLDVMKCFWLHDKITLIDVMTNVLTSCKCLMTWHTFWLPGAIFDVMTNFMCFTLWRTFCGYDVFLTPWPAFCCLDIFFIISGTKYNENVFAIITNFWMSWHVFHVMTHLLTSWQTLDVMMCFWCYDELCDAVFFCVIKLFYIMTYFWSNDGFVFGSNDEPFTITNLLTSWQTFWHHDVFLISWQHLEYFWRHDKSCDVMTNFLAWWRLVDVMANCLM